MARTLTMRRHKGTDRAYVWLGGKSVYLGKWKSPEANSAYHRITAEFHSNNGIVRKSRNYSMIEFCDAYLSYAKEYYRNPDGRISSEYACLLVPVRILIDLYADFDVTEFGSLQLKAVINVMIQNGIYRTSINRHISRIKRMANWGASERIFPTANADELDKVCGLQRGRTKAIEGEPVLAVPDKSIDATVEALESIGNYVVAAMIKLQRLTGARPHEICDIRFCDIDRSKLPWRYVPKHHKTAHKGKKRIIVLGPQERELIAPFVDESQPERYLFSPTDAINAIRTWRTKQRKTGVTSGNRSGYRPAGFQRKGGLRLPRNQYDSDSYRRSIARACELAGIEKWKPNQIRHTAATEFEIKYGIEATSTLLGHADPTTTRIYAEGAIERVASIIEGRKALTNEICRQEVEVNDPMELTHTRHF